MSRTAVDWFQLARELRDRAFSCAIRSSFAQLGSGSVIEMPTTVTGARRIVIGRDVRVGRGSWLYTHDEPASLTIGRRTSISRFCVPSAAKSVTIGESVLMARGVYIADHNHGHRQPGVPVRDQALDDIAAVMIGDGAWLGQNVVILPGSRVGRGAVVGANSIVRGTIPDRGVAVGAPARIVKMLDNRDAA